ncbi:hypothetical protein PAHAL_7G340200 [Panicum hallii]|uniref:Myb/SANT-like domain-containing protein n=1 Tax=Panicum hallii TaxID=206008 RepID=A0A2T8IEB9_9POAL|nr:L10-interacting MYB domain-containing protein-like [Panicum hallii]PVH36019.1 hypothetical protein PAHAL_7G340200 [Panicum hallii]
MEWTDEYNAIVSELMAEQVRKGNRPNTHLNTLGYTEVMGRFYQMTGIELSKIQVKNKWDKLKNDWSIWQKLVRKQTGTGWDSTRGVISMDNEWWKKMKKEIPGCGKFKKKALQNQDFLREMFGDISNDETDHWNPMSDNPIIPNDPIVPNSQQEFENIDEDGEQQGGEEEGWEDMVHDWGYMEDNDTEAQEVSPVVGNQKRRPRVVLEIPKKQKTSTALVIQEQITKIADSASSFTSRKQAEVGIKEVMDLVLDCGADYGSNEHDIATQLFVKRDQREMFLTLPTREIRFNWLTRRYNDKYGN